jgi:hypothetical protein
MSAHRFKVGVSALFDPSVTPHARTFLRAVAVAADQFAEVAALEMVFLDDGAEPRRARQVAQRFLDEGVDVVVGHFSSDAAQAAAGLYAQAQVPLLTPAATLSLLTRSWSNVFRLCPPDALLARRLVDFARDQGWCRCSVACDTSAHGRELARDIQREADKAGVLAPAGAPPAEVAIFAGRLAASRQYLIDRRAGGHRGPVVLTDDAASPHLLSGLPDVGPVFVLSFSPPNRGQAGMRRVLRAHLDMFGAEPDVYFAESVAALAVAAALRDHDAAGRLRLLQDHAITTALGGLRFHAGELEQASHTVWRAEAGQLRPWRELTLPILATDTGHDLHPHS